VAVAHLQQAESAEAGSEAEDEAEAEADGPRQLLPGFDLRGLLPSLWESATAAAAAAAATLPLVAKAPARPRPSRLPPPPQPRLASARAGAERGGGLSLPGFVSALLMASFEVHNPDYSRSRPTGEVAAAAHAAGVGVAAPVDVEACARALASRVAHVLLRRGYRRLLEDVEALQLELVAARRRVSELQLVWRWWDWTPALLLGGTRGEGAEPPAASLPHSPPPHSPRLSPHWTSPAPRGTPPSTAGVPDTSLTAQSAAALRSAQAEARDVEHRLHRARQELRRHERKLPRREWREGPGLPKGRAACIDGASLVAAATKTAWAAQREHERDNEVGESILRGWQPEDP